MCEFFFKIALSLIIVLPAAGAIHWIWTHQIDPKASVDRLFQGLVKRDWLATREPTKLYQRGVPVADITGAVNRSGNRIVFDQLTNTAALKQNEELEYKKLRLRVVKVSFVKGQEIVATPGGVAFSRVSLKEWSARS